jgi:hypothetical protein
VKFAGQEQPTFATRTIESTIRLKDGETNFLAGLIQSNKIKSATKTPILGDLPFIGRLFTNEKNEESRTDLVLTMTPHIIRIPDITEEDVAPMWVGTGNNLTFRGVSPRIESQSGVDPFVPARSNAQFQQLAEDGEPGNYIQPEPQPTTTQPTQTPGQGGGPYDPFNRPQPQPPTPPASNNPPVDQRSSLESQKQPAVETTMASSTTSSPKLQSVSASALAEDDIATLRLAPRIAPQPTTIALGPGQSKLWNVVGMDLDGLSAETLQFQFDPRAMDVTETVLGPALLVDPLHPPIVEIDRTKGTIVVRHANGDLLQFVSGGTVLTIRVHGGLTGETYLVMQNPGLRNKNGEAIVAAIGGGRAAVN